MENANEINKKIAQNLIYYRKAAGLTQAELAEKINYSDKSVSKWESGNGIPDVYTLLQLAKLYNVTLSVLVGEEQPVKEPEIKQKSIEELKEAILESKKELFTLKISHNRVNQLENTASISNKKREIARMKTVLRQKELNA